MCIETAYLSTIIIALESTHTMFARLANSLRNYRSHKRTISLLTQMEDRQLWDIGLLRGDIETVVRRGRLTF